MTTKLLSLYGLKFNPFRPDVPIEALYTTPAVDAFLRRVELGIADGGFALITGDPGTGKSVALRLLAERLARAARRRRRHHRASAEPHLGLLPRARRPLRRPAPGPQPLGRLQGPARALERAHRHDAHAPRAHHRRGPGGPHHRLQRAAPARQQGPRLAAAALRRPRRRRSSARAPAPPELLPLGSRIRRRLVLDYASRDELLACLDHLLDAAGNATLMTTELKATLADHAAGNYRVLMNLADELLAVAADRELPRLDEKLYLEVFGQPARTKHASPKRNDPSSADLTRRTHEAAQVRSPPSPLRRTASPAACRGRRPTRSRRRRHPGAPARTPRRRRRPDSPPPPRWPLTTSCVSPSACAAPSTTTAASCATPTHSRFVFPSRLTRCVPQKTRSAFPSILVRTLHQQGLSRRAIARALAVSRNTVRKLLTAHGRGPPAPNTRARGAAGACPAGEQARPVPDQARASCSSATPTSPRSGSSRSCASAGFDGGYTAVKKQVREPSAAKPARAEPRDADATGRARWPRATGRPTPSTSRSGRRQTVQAFAYVLAYSEPQVLRLYERKRPPRAHGRPRRRPSSASRARPRLQVRQPEGGRAPLGGPPAHLQPALPRLRHPLRVPAGGLPARSPQRQARVERAFWEFERSFLNGRSFRDLDDMRAQLAQWERTICDRPPAQALHADRARALRRGAAAPAPAAAATPTTPRASSTACAASTASSPGRQPVRRPLRARHRHPAGAHHPARALRLRRRPARRAPRARARAAPAHDVDPQLIHPPLESARGADLDQLEQPSPTSARTAASLLRRLSAAAQPRLAGYHARQILLLRERYAHQRPRRRPRATRSPSAPSTTRPSSASSRARATPRRLDEYVAEDAASGAVEAPSTQGDTRRATSTSTTACPHPAARTGGIHVPTTSNPQAPTSSLERLRRHLDVLGLTYTREHLEEHLAWATQRAARRRRAPRARPRRGGRLQARAPHRAPHRP